MMIMKSKAARKTPRRYSQVARAVATEVTATRIIDSFLELLMSEWFDDITLYRVATGAGVAVPTLIRRFGGKDGLLVASIPVLADRISEQRAAPRGDVAGAVDRLIADYERTGDSIIRVLAIEPRFPAVEPLTTLGRAKHREWAATVFAESLRSLSGTARERALDARVIATDVYTWKLLRRDMRRSLKDTATTMKRLAGAAMDL
ncbi:MAG: TetR/AcrR family transcriptional regulator [Panacagrimonas sp.]